MLSKLICERCCRRHWPEIWARNAHDPADFSAAWVMNDEKLWSKGAVLCPMVGQEAKHANIEEEPPSHCPYRFEHAVAAGADSA